MPTLWRISSVGSSVFWIALRRSGHDARARRQVLRYLGIRGLFLIPVAVMVGWLVFKLLEIVGFTFRNFALTFGSIVLFLGLYVGVGMAIHVFGDSIVETARSMSDAYRRWLADLRRPAVSPQLKISLHREVCLLATLLERMSSEIAMEKELPPNIEVITRRVLLDRLESLALRDQLESWMLDTLLTPDGHWTVEQKSRAWAAVDCFAVLNWTLGMGELPSLTARPQYIPAHLRAVFAIDRPERLLVLPSWDLRLARDGADQFVNRCWTELVARGMTEGTPEEHVALATEYRSEILEAGFTEDYLVGARTMSEVEPAVLLSLWNRAHNRRQLLSLLVEITAERVPLRQLRDFLSVFFLPALESGA